MNTINVLENHLMNKAINNIDQLPSFIQFDSEYDFYVVNIIKRIKDGHSSTRTIDERYIFSINDLNEYVEKNINLCDEENYRIYINPNRRRMDKMGVRCISLMTEYLISHQHKSIPNVFRKVVGNCNDESIKKWIVDIDSSDESILNEVTSFINNIHKQFSGSKGPYKMLGTLPTPYGFHIVTNPFNLSTFNKVFLYKGSTFVDKITIHKNSPTLLYCPEIKRSSNQWLAMLQKEKPNFQILDPDGWDRLNYQFSFNEEKISKEEFNGRLMTSTIIGW